MDFDLRSHRVVEEDVHPPPMNLVDGTAPFLDVSEVGVEEGEVEGLCC